jgi:hypothetical protein
VDEPTPGAAIVGGLNVAVVPAGRPDAESAIAELKLPVTVVVTVAAPELPRVIASADGEDEIAKSPAGVPEVVAFSAKSSTTKEVLSFEFSTPIR